MPVLWGREPWFFPVALVAHLVAAALWARAVRPWLADRAARRTAGATALVGLAWVGLCLLAVPRAFPAAWLTVIQEGFTHSMLGVLTGGGLHGGPALAGFWHAWLPDGATSMRDVVAINLAAWGVALLLLGHVAVRIAGDATLAVILVVGVACSPVSLSMATSAQPGPLLALYVVAGAVPAISRRGVRGAERVALLALLGVLAAAVRVEAAAFALAAVPVAIAQEVAPEPLARAQARIVDAVGRVPWPVWPTLLAAWAFLGPSLVRATPWWPLPPPSTWWVQWAIHPGNLALLTAPILWLAILPLGAASLVLRGHLEGIVRVTPSVGVAWASAGLYAVYVAAAHGNMYDGARGLAVHEMFRYAGNLLPVWVLLAAWAIGPVPSRGARAAWTVLLLVPPLAPAITWLPQHLRDQDQRVAPFPWVGTTDGDLQRQARALQTVRDAHPDCTVLTRSRTWGSSPQEPVVEDWLVYNHPYSPSSQLRSLPVADGLGLDRLQPGDLTTSGCLILWIPLDCDLARDQVPCADLRAAAPDAAVTRFPTRPFVFADHTGGWQGDTQGWAWTRVDVPAEVAERVATTPYPPRRRR